MKRLTIEDMKRESRLQELRVKWSEAKKVGDSVMMAIFERQARAIKISQGE